MGMRSFAGVVVLAAAAACGRAPAPAPIDVPVAEARAEAERWRAKHEADYRREWSTIAGLHFLTDGAQTAGSAQDNGVVLPPSAPPRLGVFTLNGETVRFEPAAGTTVTLNGQPVTSGAVLADDGSPHADELATGAIRLVVHRSGNRRSLRVWDPDGPQAKGFLGFRWFDIQPAARVIGHFERDASSRTLRVPNTFGDLDEFTTEGVVTFTINGQTVRLRPFTTRPGRLYFVFRDGSSGKETYAAARFLYADLRADGTVVLDFNQAYNPPCSFNPFTTCPVPLPENRLTVPILAGEQAYPVHVELPRS